LDGVRALAYYFDQKDAIRLCISVRQLPYRMQIIAPAVLQASAKPFMPNCGLDKEWPL
jgi:hypothetical protein